MIFRKRGNNASDDDEPGQRVDAGPATDHDQVGDDAATPPDSVDDIEILSSDATESGASTTAAKRSARWRPAAPRLVAVTAMSIIVALGALAGWLGFQAHRAQQASERHARFLQTGRQAAVNLTTIDWQNADADVQRIMDSATGTFAGDFAQRTGAFVEVVKQARSKSEGAVTEAGVESETLTAAKVLVTVNVKTTMNGAPEQGPRLWRMRISVQRTGDDVKVANVEFVP